MCPSHADPRDGTPPNPATCGGGCAPFLFGEEPLPEGINDATLDLPFVEVDQLTTVSRSRPQEQEKQQQQDQQLDQQQNQPKGQRVPKRTDTDTKHGDQGRSLTKATTSNLTQSSSPESSIVDSNETTKKNSRQPHNKVEQKYRDSINNQMEALRKVVPSLSESARIDDADIEDLPVPSRPSKAVILASATAFIKVQTKEKRELETENDALRQRVQALQAMFDNKCDHCSILQQAIGMNLRGGTNMGQLPLSWRS